MEDQVQTAKALFMHHMGSMIQMHRKGVFAQYKSYEIAPDTEAQW